MASEINNDHVLDVSMTELPDNYRDLVLQACEQYQRKCLMSFSKNKSNKVFQKQSMPRVLLPHQTDYTEEEDAQKMAALVYKLVGRQLPIAVCRCKWLQGRIYGTVWSHLTCSGFGI